MRRRAKTLLFSIPIGDIELRVHGYDALTPRDIENIRKAVDMMEETMQVIAQADAEDELRSMEHQEVEITDMSK